MTMFRVPIFSWNMLVTGILILIAFPVLFGAVVMLFCDRHFGTHIFTVQGGGVPVLWQNLFWFFGHPEVYILALPYFGMVTDIIPVFSRKPLFGYKGMVFATMSIAALSTGVWAHHMFTTGVVLLPVLLAALLPDRRAHRHQVLQLDRHHVGRPAELPDARCSSRIGFLFAFLMGGVTGVLLASPPVDFMTHDTYFVVAHFHQVLIGTAVFAGFAGFYFWYPKMFGRMLREQPRQAPLLVLFIGFWVTFMPQYVLGLDGMPRRVAAYLPSNGWTTPQRDLDGRRLHHRRLVPLLPGQPLDLVAQADPGRRQPLGRPHPRVVHLLAAAPPQLHPPAPDPLGAADLGLQPPRAPHHPHRPRRQAARSRYARMRPSGPAREGLRALPRRHRRLLRHHRHRLLVHQLRGRRLPDADRLGAARPVPRLLLPVVVVPR